MKKYIKQLINRVLDAGTDEPRAKQEGVLSQGDSIDLLIGSLFDMLNEEAPDSGALCISLENGGLVVAAESLEHAYNVLEQCHAELNQDLTPGYYGAPVEA